MRRWDEFVRGQLDGGAVAARNGDRPVVARFGDLRREHAALSDGPALVDRSYRGLLEASGADRATWLHSIATNQVTTLQVGEGNYAFVLSANGRLVFDVNVLVCAEAVWLDIDRAAADAAVAHLSKHIIMEDVALTDRSDDFIRLGLTGERAKDVAVGLGAPHAANLPLLGHTTLTCDGVTITVLRSDLCGSFALELFVASDRAVDVYHALTDGRFAPAAMPVGADAVRIRRIEAGLPRYGAELHADVVPAETGQCDRAVSTNKGCYPGQEVVERMRSRGAVARRLVGLVIDGDHIPSAGATVSGADGRPVGAVTSACRSIALQRVIALAYVKAAVCTPGTALAVARQDEAVGAEVVRLPFVDSQPHRDGTGGRG